MASSVFETPLRRHPYVKFVDDERDLENGIIVTLVEGRSFREDPGCGVRAFDKFTQAYTATLHAIVRQSCCLKLKQCRCCCRGK